MKMPSSLAKPLGGLLLLACLATPAQAQLNPRETSVYGAAAFYRYAEAGDLTIRVQAWGSVRFPGLYQIPMGSRVSRLMSLSGGPQYALERRRQDERTTTIRLFRPDSLSREPRLVFEQEWVNGAEAFTQDPVLREGDMLAIDSVVKEGYTWRDYAPVAVSAASLFIGLLGIVITATR